jgi:Kef-type K+ transport system membrane component KefB
MIGYMMNTRALMELIVINVGLDLGVISPTVFTMLVIMAIVSTVITTPALKYYMARGSIDRLPPSGAAAAAPARTIR